MLRTPLWGKEVDTPLGLAAGQTEEDLSILKTLEIQHSRLAMMATFVFVIEGLAGHGPLDFAN